MVDHRNHKVYEDIYLELEGTAMKDENLKNAFRNWEELSMTQEEYLAYESRLKRVLDEEAAQREMELWKKELKNQQGEIEKQRGELEAQKEELKSQKRELEAERQELKLLKKVLETREQKLNSRKALNGDSHISNCSI